MKSKPRNKKYVPKKVINNPMKHLVSGLHKIPYDMAIMLKVRKHYALKLLKEGSLNKEHFESLIEMVNMAIVLLEFHFTLDHLPDLFLARDALKRIGLRYRVLGSFNTSDEDLSHINYAMDIHSMQLDMLRIIDIENACNEIDRRLTNGINVVKIKEG